MSSTSRCIGLWCVVLFTQAQAFADVRLPTLFSDHMVLQRDMNVPIWGWARPGEKVKVKLPNQELATQADAGGRWRVTARPLAPGGSFTLRVEGDNLLQIQDVQVGDVWLCSGQSNMQWSVAESRDADLEVPAANFPNIRLITVATPGGQKPLDNFDGSWQPCSSATARDFSAVGYFFGRQMHQIIRVPIGLIDNAWGGSACEAWIRRDALEGNPLYEHQLSRWDKLAVGFDEKKATSEYRKRMSEWQRKANAARQSGAPEPPGWPTLENPITGQHRPANLYNGRLRPVMPYAIRGVIWYQGETNAERAQQYREMFPLMIKSWREEWGQGDFPFYWVQLADFKPEKNEPGDSTWAELRDAQTMSLDVVPNSGQAVIIDLGEANDIHPRNKQDVAKRLARLALAKTFKQKLSAESPRYQSMLLQGDRVLIRLKSVNGKLRTPDDVPIEGFAIAGADRKWVWADAKIVGDAEVVVQSDAVRNPFAVRYAWADNPVCNLYDSAGLPVTPFRTDSWPGITDGVR